MSRAAVTAYVRGLGKRLSGKVADPTGATRRVVRAGAEKALELVRMSFVVRSKGGTDATGLKWKPLKPATLKAKRKAGEPPDALVRSGSLLGSLGVGAKKGLSVKAITLRDSPAAIAIGTDIPYAAHHHRGTKSLPRRPLWPDPKDWPAAWWQQIANAMASQMAKELAAGAANVKGVKSARLK